MESRQQAGLGEPSHVGPGTWSVDYRPRRLVQPTRDVVVARAGPLLAEHSIEIAAHAARFTFGPKAGLGFQGGDRSVAAGGEASAWTRLGGHEVGLFVEASYWSLTSSGTTASLGDYSGQRGYLPLLLSAGWRRPVWSQMMVWAAAGGGAALVNASSHLASQPTVSDLAWAPAVSGAFSVGRWAWKGFPFVELRATWVGDPRLPVLRGSLTAVLLQLGYRFHAE
jgi:hypothetical protein